MSGLLAGKSALITGGGSGIGRATALIFAREGANLAIADVADDGARETVAMVKATGAKALAIHCDISKLEEVRSMIETATKAYGRLDCAFNNAGLGPGQLGMTNVKLADWPEEIFDRMIRVNLKGVWLCMKHELLCMVAQGGGAIVNTSSISGLVGVAGTAGYNASKHGVIGLTKTAAVEYAESNIRINAVCPGPIRTAMSDATAALRGGEVRVTQVPMGRRGEPEDIAEIVLFLCSDRAAYITGTAFPIDGGWTAC
jgi:NAD(P)-dependent dehydrogenase (short-subunit alcohol dehydrogenase family)